MKAAVSLKKRPEFTDTPKSDWRIKFQPFSSSCESRAPKYISWEACSLNMHSLTSGCQCWVIGRLGYNRSDWALALLRSSSGRHFWMSCLLWSNSTVSPNPRLKYPGGEYYCQEWNGRSASPTPIMWFRMIFLVDWLLILSKCLCVCVCVCAQVCVHVLPDNS